VFYLAISADTGDALAERRALLSRCFLWFHSSIIITIIISISIIIISLLCLLGFRGLFRWSFFSRRGGSSGRNCCNVRVTNNTGLRIKFIGMIIESLFSLQLIDSSSLGEDD
jgi:hypothetical protein